MSLEIPKTSGTVNLAYCVANVQMDLEDYSDRLKERATQYAIRALSNINMFQSKNVEVAYLTMSDLGVIDFTSLTDYVDYIKIGIIINGKWWILGLNNKITLRRTELNAATSALIFKGQDSNLEITSSYFFAPHYVQGQFVNSLYGMGGGFSRSYYRIDTEKRLIQFDTQVPVTQIALEYISTGIKPDGSTVIPRYMLETIVAYIHWQLKLHREDITRFEKRELKEEFIEQENIMNGFVYSFNPTEYLDMTYSTFRQGAKR
jgi:hypothetical protein